MEIRHYPTNRHGVIIASLILLLVLPLYKARGDEVTFELVPTGAGLKHYPALNYQLLLDDEQPSGIKKLPDDLAAPRFGKLKLGPGDSATTFYLVIDTPQGKPARFWIDANANGDLTDDPAAEWHHVDCTVHKPKGDAAIVNYVGGATVTVPYGQEKLPLHLIFEYHPDRNDPKYADNRAGYHFDFARVGKMKLGDKTYAALLLDIFGLGDFRGRSEGEPGVRLLLDLNDDHIFDLRSEGVPIKQPFNIDGTTYQITKLTAAGDTLTFSKSSQTVPETKPAPINNGPAVIANSFQATTTDGQNLRFPADEKGKLVLLQFWSTGSEPCIEELPQLEDAYKKYHSKGLDIVGICLDSANSNDSLRQFTHDHLMVWPQIYDGKAWAGSVFQKYGWIASEGIPYLMLVDGSNGRILARRNQLLGDNLSKTIEVMLDKKRQ